MNNVEQHLIEPKALPGWACLATGIGFIVAVGGLLLLVRGLAG
jgi:hypothetical protein